MADAPEATEGKKKSGILKYIILLILLLVLGGGGYFAYLKFFAAKPAPKAESAEQASKEDATKSEEHAAAATETPPAAESHGGGGHGEAKGGHGGKEAPSNLVALPAFVVNLADPNARRYLKVVLSVEVVSNPELLEANQAKIRDALLMLLSSKTSQDLSTLEGKIMLRKDIVDRINQAIGQAKVARVYFTDFVIQ